MRDATTLYYPDFEPSLDWLKAFLLFNDNIARIVPTDVERFDSKEFKQFRDIFPDVVEDIPSSSELVELDDARLERLDKAFQKIAKERLDLGRISMSFPEPNSISYPGFVMLHRSKISRPVMRLLEKHNLVPEVYQIMFNNVASSLDKGSFIVIKEEASSLILSMVADRVASDRGIDTVTDNPIDYSLLSLNAVGVGEFSGHVPGKKVDKLLASAFITTQVPETLAALPLQDYNELRKEFEDLREPFDKLISDHLSSLQLQNISNDKILAEQIEKSASEFSVKLRKLQKKNKFSYIKRWTPYVAASLVQLTALLQADIRITTSLTLLSLTISGIEKLFSNDIGQLEKDGAKIHRRLVGLKRELMLREFQEWVKHLI